MLLSVPAAFPSLLTALLPPPGSCRILASHKECPPTEAPEAHLSLFVPGHGFTAWGGGGGSTPAHKDRNSICPETQTELFKELFAFPVFYPWVTDMAKPIVLYLLLQVLFCALLCTL